MCRILGIVADAPTEFHFCLREAPRSMGYLSREHSDGWGVAVCDAADGWSVQKEPLSAFADPRFVEVAGDCRGTTLVAHVRRRTVGPVSIENTHPFKNGRWVFAHNGTITEIDRLRAASSPERLSQVLGSTDSELFFAYLLTRMDAVAEGGNLDAAVANAVTEMASQPTFGACNFLLSDGETLYAFRQGRTLHLLQRAANDEPPSQPIPSSEPGASLEARWTQRRRMVLVASEPITDETWTPIDEGTLLKVTRRPRPEVTTLASL